MAQKKVSSKKTAGKKAVTTSAKRSSKKNSAAKKAAPKKSGGTVGKAAAAVGQAVAGAGSAIGTVAKAVLPVSLGGRSAKADTPYNNDVIKLAKANENFRQVIYTTELSQLVLMSVPAGGEIGSEVHTGIDQVLSFVEGEGEAILNRQASKVGVGSVVVVPAGTQHNFVNTGRGPLKLYTVYTPPEHEDGTVHRTKAEADEDEGHY